MNYYQHHIGDYRRDTGHLSLLEHGVYGQLLDMYYLSEGKIPEETESLYRRLCARTDEEKKAVDTVLKEFFTHENGWKHTRCDKEIAAYSAKADRARDNGKLGGRPQKTKEVISGNRDETETKANHKPLTNNHKPIIKTNTSAIADDAGKPHVDVKKGGAKVKKSVVLTATDLIAKGVSERVAREFMAIVKTKKKPLTATALAGIEREAEKAGATLESVLTLCCEKSWARFEADWITNQQRSQNGPPKSFDEQKRERSRQRVAEFATDVADRVHDPTRDESMVIETVSAGLIEHNAFDGE